MINLIDKILPRRAERIMRRHGRKMIVLSLIKPLFFFLLESDSSNYTISKDKFIETKRESNYEVQYNQNRLSDTTNLKNYIEYPLPCAED